MITFGDLALIFKVTIELNRSNLNQIDHAWLQDNAVRGSVFSENNTSLVLNKVSGELRRIDYLLKMLII